MHARDGDTIEVGGLPIRLNGLAAPEGKRNGRHRSHQGQSQIVLGGELRANSTVTAPAIAAPESTISGARDISEVMVAAVWPGTVPGSAMVATPMQNRRLPPMLGHREDLSPAQLLSAALNCAMATDQPITRDVVIRQAAFARAGIAFGTPPEPLKHHGSSLDLTPAASACVALSWKQNASPRRRRDGRLGSSPGRVSLPPRCPTAQERVRIW
jgi:hypothetical protein